MHEDNLASNRSTVHDSWTKLNVKWTTKVKPTKLRLNLEMSSKGKGGIGEGYLKTSQEVQMLSGVSLYCQVTNIVMFWGSQLSMMSRTSQMSQVSSMDNRSQISKIALWGCSLNVYHCISLGYCLFLVRSCFPITLCKYCKGHKSETSRFEGVL